MISNRSEAPSPAWYHLLNRTRVKNALIWLLGSKAIGIYYLSKRSALDAWGWYSSIQHGFPCDEQGNPVPWISYPAIEFLKARVKPDWEILEFGAGYSTLWWGRLVASVVSCEHDAAWCSTLTPILPGNCRLMECVLNEEYPLAATRFGLQYDVIVIDGRKRVKCAVNSVRFLKPGGIIVWDDSDREYYRPGIDHLKALGFKSVEFVGMSPRIASPKQTSIFYRNFNVVGL